LRPGRRGKGTKTGGKPITTMVGGVGCRIPTGDSTVLDSVPGGYLQKRGGTIPEWKTARRESNVIPGALGNV